LTTRVVWAGKMESDLPKDGLCILGTEEEEPLLKFQQLETQDSGNDPTNRLFSCLSVSDRLLVITCSHSIDPFKGLIPWIARQQAIGTHGGSVRILDLLGSPVKVFPNIHSASVTQVALDDSGEFVASVSDDGLSLSGLDG
jgi:hypothetical protein